VRPTLLKLSWTTGLLLAAAGCGSPGAGEAPGPPSLQPEVAVSAAMTALPSRSIAFDHFALEGALDSQLSEADGVDGEASTTWALSGDGVEVRMDVSTWLSPAEAEESCQSNAGPAVAPSLALGTPSWTTDTSVYVTQGASCIQVTVVRGRHLDVAAAGTVADVLVTANAT